MTAPDDSPVPRAVGETVRDIAELDLASGSLRVGSQSVDVHGLSNADLLRRYVALVRVERKLAPGARIVLRDADVAALASVLDVEDSELERDLVAIVGLDRAAAADVRRRLSRRRLAAPMAGLALGSIGLFGLRQLTQSGGDSASAPSVVVAGSSLSAPSDVAVTAPAADSGVASVDGSADDATAETTSTSVAVPTTISVTPSTTAPSVNTVPPVVTVEPGAPVAPTLAPGTRSAGEQTSPAPTSPASSRPVRTTTVAPAPSAGVAMPVFGDAPSISVPPIDSGVDVDPDADDPFDPIAGAVVIVDPVQIEPITLEPITVEPSTASTTSTTVGPATTTAPSSTSTTIAPNIGDGGVSLTP
jgi:hypothetical protein